MAKVLVVGGYVKFLMNFRGHLLEAMVNEGHDVIAAAPGRDEEIERKLESMGVGYLPIQMDRAGMNPVRDFKSIFRFSKQIKKIKPDVVLSYNCFTLCFTFFYCV